MSYSNENRKTVNLSINLPDDISAIIEHHAIMRAKDPEDILREVVQKMIDDNGKQIAELLAGGK